MTLVNTSTGELIVFDKAAAERRAERITLRLDAIADNYRAVLPMIREAIEKRDDLALGYRSPGDYVSDRFGQSLAGLGIEVRREVVRELTQAGMTTRAIAPVVDVSQKTVDRDVRRVFSGESHDSPDPEVIDAELVDDETPEGEVAPGGSESPVKLATPRPPVTGIDGKTYTTPERSSTMPRTLAKPTEIERPPAPPKYGGNRKKHLAVIDSIATAASGLAIAAEEITSLDQSVTDGEAARLADDLSKSIRSLNRIKTLLKERTS